MTMRILFCGWTVALSMASAACSLSAAPINQSRLQSIPRSADAIVSENVMIPLYEFAALHPEVLKQMPCFCSCGQRLGHRSNYDCFITSTSGNHIAWNVHAAECHYCVAVARDVKQLFEARVPIVEIRRRIEATYAAGSKYRTDTPELHSNH